MSSYVFMKVLESAPERYDRGIRWLSGGAIDELYDRIAAQVAGDGLDILDLGCGTGGLAIASARRGARVVGVDMNPGMLDVARSKVEGASLAGSVELVELGVMELEDRFEPNSFDAATASLLFSELLPEEQRYVLRKLYELLHPGGRVVVGDEIHRGGARGWWRRVRRLPMAALTHLLTQTGTRPVENLEAKLAEAGFVQIEVDSDAPGGAAIFTAVRPKDAA